MPSIGFELSPEQVFVLDGAMGTELVNIGVTEFGKPGWTVRPHLSEAGRDGIKAVHHAYIAAGADVICTHSYNLNEEYIERTGLPLAEGTDIAAMQKRSVQLAFEAIEEAAEKRSLAISESGSPVAKKPKLASPKVAAVMGPYAAAVSNDEYDYDYSKVSEDTLVNFHRKRVKSLAAASPDILLFETLSSITEVKAICKLLEELSLSAWVAFACGSADKTCTGDSWSSILHVVNGSDNITAVGVNCTKMAYVEELLKTARELTAKPLIAYPNNGVWCAKSSTWLPQSPGDYADQLKKVASPASLLGGCCCVGPKEISALSELIHKIA